LRCCGWNKRNGRAWERQSLALWGNQPHAIFYLFDNGGYGTPPITKLMALYTVWSGWDVAEVPVVVWNSCKPQPRKSDTTAYPWWLLSMQAAYCLMLANEPHLPHLLHLIDTSKKEDGNLPACFRHLGAENTRTPSNHAPTCVLWARLLARRLTALWLGTDPSTRGRVYRMVFLQTRPAATGGKIRLAIQNDPARSWFDVAGSFIFLFIGPLSIYMPDFLHEEHNYNGTSSPVQ